MEALNKTELSLIDSNKYMLDTLSFAHKVSQPKKCQTQKLDLWSLKQQNSTKFNLKFRIKVVNIIDIYYDAIKTTHLSSPLIDNYKDPKTFYLN